MEEEDVRRSDEVVHVDGRIVRELEKQDTSPNANMDLSEDGQVEISVDNRSDDAEINSDNDSDVE